MEKSNCQS